LPQPYRCQEDNICQSIWDKIEVLLRTLWGNVQIGNLLGTHWKHSGNKLDKGENENFLQPPPPSQRKKLGFLECMMHHLVGCLYPYLGQFESNYIIFRNFQIFKKYFFQNQKILWRIILNI
jgi:hypothetical protein